MNLNEIAKNICIKHIDKVKEYIAGDQSAIIFLQFELLNETKGHINLTMCKDLLKIIIKNLNNIKS